MNPNSILNRLVNLVSKMITTVYEGFLFLGDTEALIMAIVDILVTTLLIYYVLNLLRKTRAWQLLKGVVFVIFLAILPQIFGLTTMAYVLSRLISVLAIAFVVIFQPELRKALETVGRSGFSMFTSSENQLTTKQPLLKSIDAIAAACGHMIQDGTGSLILIERTTALDEFLKQNNACTLDAEISSTALEQIFYLGSPLHDGAALVRGDRLVAARIHIPLTEGFAARTDRGTRHRAAMEASNIGDTLAVVTSEEHKTISLAVGGKLFFLRDAQALKMQLQYYLLPREEKQTLRDRLHGFWQERKDPKVGKKRREDDRRFQKRRLMLFLASLFISMAIWFYVQAMVNPLKTKSFSVPLTYRSDDQLLDEKLTADLPVDRVLVTLTARTNLIDYLRNSDIQAYIDLGAMKQEGIQSMQVNVQVDTKLHTRLDNVSPDKVLVAVRTIKETSEGDHP